jgi:hypothetical protein
MYASVPAAAAIPAAAGTAYAPERAVATEATEEWMAEVPPRR